VSSRRVAAPGRAILRAVPALPIVALFGPTGVGKTEVAIALAELLRADGEDPVAVSADALQLYAGVEILTGAATAPERARLEHRLVGILPLTARATAGDFARRAHAEIDGLIAAGRRPIVVGGTGLYLRAALADLDLRPPPDAAIRARYATRLAADGAPALHAELADRDPEAAATIAPTDAQRVVRALELLDAGASPPGGEQLWTAETRHPTLLVALTMERDALYARIDARVTAMVAAGAAEEVARAHAAGVSPAARQALGFTELLEGDVDAMRRRTRRYAKRQLTWLRKLPGALTIDLTARDAQSAAEEVRSALRVAAESSSEPMKRENGPMNAQ
jgi:tRNA dimethylallyltransferase